MTHKRITAREITPGMRVARARTHPFRQVEEVHHGPRAVTLVYATTFHPDYPPRPGARFGGRQTDRPRLDAAWWREAPEEDTPNTRTPAPVSNVLRASEEIAREDGPQVGTAFANHLARLRTHERGQDAGTDTCTAAREKFGRGPYEVPAIADQVAEACDLRAGGLA
jgi:hypothetical protein